MVIPIGHFDPDNPPPNIGYPTKVIECKHYNGKCLVWDEDASAAKQEQE